MNAMPGSFIERMSRQLRDELPDFLHALEQPAIRGIRMNRMKPFTGMEAYTSGERVPWAEEGFILREDSLAGSTVFHEAGAFYLQEPAAMLPAEIMDARPGERILDLCSAPGGKATQMGLNMKGRGLLVCNEPVLKRAQILRRNMERMGIPNGIVISAYPEEIPSSWNELFDGVMVDAPCSGEGMFRRDPESRSEWSPEKAAGCAKRQREILREAVRLIKPGGRLVYATCTFNPQENDENVEWLLKEFPDFEAESFRKQGVDGKNGTFLCMPHRMKGEGQFVAKIRKKGEAGEKRLSVPFDYPGKRETDILQSIVPGIQHPNCMFRNELLRMPECPDLKGIRVLKAGLKIAEINGKTLTPHHSAALDILRNNAQTEELNAEDAARYIAGEEVSGESKGWTMLTFRSLILGWGKGSNGTIKNHYPKGLRKEHIRMIPG